MKKAGYVSVGVFLGAAAMVFLSRRARNRNKNRRLHNRVVLITGGSRGLGLALAEECGRRGAKLALIARSPNELERAKALLVQRGVAEKDVATFATDLRKQVDTEQAVRSVAEHFGRVDVLINNAGVITVGPVENQAAEDFRDVMDANFFSGLHCTLAVLPEMLARRSGKIVNIASIGGKIPVPHLLPYTASKFAVVGFSEGLNAELRSKGVEILTVCPGLMRTGSHLNALFTGDAEREYRWFSLGASLPGISVSAARAARLILNAMMSSRSEISITPQAALAARVEGLFPAAMNGAMRIANALLLPRAVSQSKGTRRGSSVRKMEIGTATLLGSRAARRYNQTGSDGPEENVAV